MGDDTRPRRGTRKPKRRTNLFPAVASLLILGLLIGQLWIRLVTYGLASTIETAKNQKESLEAQNSLVEAQIVRLSSRSRVETYARQVLAMDYPQAQQKVLLGYGAGEKLLSGGVGETVAGGPTPGPHNPHRDSLRPKG